MRMIAFHSSELLKVTSSPLNTDIITASCTIIIFELQSLNLFNILTRKKVLEMQEKQTCVISYLSGKIFDEIHNIVALPFGYAEHVL